MKILEIKEKDSTLIQNLLNIWESSFKATQLFLSDDEIKNIKQYVPRAILEIPILVVAKNETGNPIGFMGIPDKSLEMLFIEDKSRGFGIGKMLLNYGMENYSVNNLTVNEQPPSHRDFMNIWVLEFIKGQS